MSRHGRLGALPNAIRRKPLQTAKFAGILLTLVLGVGGFVRVVDATAVAGPLLGDGQFLALIGVPLVGLGLVVLVFVETLVSGYRTLWSDEPIGEQVRGRWGYVLIRGVEAAAALLGTALGLAALPSLFAESTPAPAGVGIMLLLLVVGVGVLFASLLRSAAELFVYAGTA